MKPKTCGREPSCDLVLEHPEVSRVHATIKLTEDGRVWVLDAGSRNGVFLERNENRVRISKVSVCIDDHIFFGEHEVAVERLTEVLGRHARVKLGKKHFSLRTGNPGDQHESGFAEPGSGLEKPRRNPETGKIENSRT